MSKEARLQKALDAYSRASPDIRAAMLKLGEARVQAQQAASSSQQQRVAQTATLLFASGAVVAQMIGGMAAVEAGLRLFILSAVAFSAAGIISIGGLLSSRVQLHGYRPSWWAGQPHEELDQEGVAHWQIENIEEVLCTLDESGERRSKALNLSLAVGGAGALALICGLLARW